jgi:putative FmdB family regulatory protein
MPVYEYYCPACDARFSHLARRFDEPAPPCPGCGSHQVEKLVSRIHLGRSDSQRREDLEARSQEVNQDDPREIARFLQQAGSLADEMAPVDQAAFREIVDRRAQGAGDQDMEDVVDAIPFPRETADHAHHTGHEHAHPHGQEHDDDHGHSHAHTHSPRKARDLGWA